MTLWRLVILFWVFILGINYWTWSNKSDGLSRYNASIWGYGGEGSSLQVTFIQRWTVGVLDFFEFALHVKMPVLMLEHLHSYGFKQGILRKNMANETYCKQNHIGKTNHFSPQWIFERNAVWLTEDLHSSLLQQQVNASLQGSQCNFFISKGDFRLIQPITLRVCLSKANYLFTKCRKKL
jgi:hypothetical protein